MSSPSVDAALQRLWEQAAHGTHLEDLQAAYALGRAWQPIDTAPKQLDAVLLYWPYWTAEPVIGARNYRIPDDGAGIEYFDSWHTERWLGEDAEDPGPTHWMPLPDPPKAETRPPAPGPRASSRDPQSR